MGQSLHSTPLLWPYNATTHSHDFSGGRVTQSEPSEIHDGLHLQTKNDAVTSGEYHTGICKPVGLADIVEIHEAFSEAIVNDPEPRPSAAALWDRCCQRHQGSDRLTLKYIKSRGPRPHTDVFILPWAMETKIPSLLPPGPEEAAERIAWQQRWLAIRNLSVETLWTEEERSRRQGRYLDVRVWTAYCFTPTVPGSIWKVIFAHIWEASVKNVLQYGPKSLGSECLRPTNDVLLPRHPRGFSLIQGKSYSFPLDHSIIMSIPPNILFSKDLGLWNTVLEALSCHFPSLRWWAQSCPSAPVRKRTMCQQDQK